MAQESPMTYEELQLAIFILGPLVRMGTHTHGLDNQRIHVLQLIACFLDILFQGVLLCQVSILGFGSFSDHKHDSSSRTISRGPITTDLGHDWLLLGSYC